MIGLRREVEIVEHVEQLDFAEAYFGSATPSGSTSTSTSSLGSR